MRKVSSYVYVKESEVVNLRGTRNLTAPLSTSLSGLRLTATAEPADAVEDMEKGSDLLPRQQPHSLAF